MPFIHPSLHCIHKYAFSEEKINCVAVNSLLLPNQSSFQNAIDSDTYVLTNISAPKLHAIAAIMHLAAPRSQFNSYRFPPSPAPFTLARPSLHSICFRSALLRTPSSSSAADPLPSDDPIPDVAAATPTSPSTPTPTEGGLLAWWRHQQSKNAELRKKLVSLGPAAVLSYGIFDGISYTTAFVIAFLAYETSTGLNPTKNVADIVKIMLGMWVGNNVTRPFRLAGAAALAPFMDTLMVRLQQKLKLPKKLYAFALITAAVAAICFAVVGVLFLSRW